MKYADYRGEGGPTRREAIGIKEQLAMALEQIGDVRVVSVTEVYPEQLRIGE